MMSPPPIFCRVKFHTRNHCFVSIPRSWRLQPGGSGIITFALKRMETSPNIFASWNGEYSDDDRVGINRQLALSMGLKEQEEVVFTLVPNLVRCFQVTLEPATPEDWQVLNMNVDTVQNGLLDQVRVFWKDLTFPFYIHSGFPISLRVVSTKPTFAPLELSQTTEVHIVPREKLDRTTTPVSSTPQLGNAASTASSSTDSVNPSRRESVDPSKPYLAARLHGSLEGPQTEVLLRSNQVEKRFVGLLRRQTVPSDAENRRQAKETAAILPDGCYPLSGGTVCHVRVEMNPWSDSENELYCPLPIRRRLGLDDCCAVMIQVLEEEFAPIGKLILNPIVNATSCPQSADTLKKTLKEEVLRKGSMIVTPGTYLELENYGVIVNAEKTGWLQREHEFSVELGRVLSPHNIESSPVPVPFVFLSEIISSGNGLEKIGGYESIVEMLIREIKDACGFFYDFRQAILLTAAEGVGKTYIMEKILGHLKQTESIFWKTISSSSQRGKRTETLVKEWQRTLVEAKARAPSVIYFDDLDAICGIPSNQEGANGADSQYISKNSRAFIELVERVKRAPERVLILASSKSWSGLSDVLTKTSGLHLFNEVVEIKPPTAEERAAIFRVQADEIGLLCENPADIGRCTDGFVGRDLFTLARRVQVKMLQENLSELTPEVLNSVVKSVVPTALRGVKMAEKTDIPPDWDCVGGMSMQKRILRETFLWPTLYPHLMKQCPIRLLSGILLYGMPGTGKTRLASCLARENRINFISVKGPELLSKYIGASELAVRDLFQRAKSAAPCVIFFDEFDSMAPRRGHDSTGVTDRCVNQLLTLLDGVETEGGVAVLAATSRPELIDPALLRPGRFDRCIECPLPESAEEREAILKALSKSVPLDRTCDFSEVAARTSNFSGADLQALLFNAQLAAVQEILPSVGGGDSDGALSTRGEDLQFDGIHHLPSLNKPRIKMTRPLFEAMPETDRLELKVLFRTSEQRSRETGVQVKLRNEHLNAALKETHPSLSENEIRKFRAIYKSFRNGGVDPNAKLKARVTLA